MTALVTGATGFIGRAVLNELVRRGEKVVAVSRRPVASPSDAAVAWRILPDTADTDWSSLLDGVSSIYHFAWSSLPLTSNADPLGDAFDNILGSLRLIEAAKRQGGVRFVFASSGGTVYGPLAVVPVPETHQTRPTCAYGVSKLTVEKYLGYYHDLHGLDSISLRISNPYGPGQTTGRNFGAVTTFASCVLEGRPITIYGDGSIVRDYLFISDLARAIVAAGSTRGPSRLINIGSGVGHSLNDIIDILRHQTGRSIEFTYCPPRTFDVPISVLDIARAKGELDWAPSVSLAEGIEMTLKALSS